MTDLKLPIAVRDDIDQPRARFKIDDVVRGMWSSGKLTGHWMSEEHALSFGRFALDKTIHMAIGAGERYLLKDIAEDWREIAGRAEHASKAMTDLLSWVAGPAYFAAPPQSDSTLREAIERAFFALQVGASPIRPDPVEKTVASDAEVPDEAAIAKWRAHTLRPAFGKMAAQERAPLSIGQNYAETIASAHAILVKFAAFSQKQRESVVAGNPGNPVLAEFILRMAETWYLLTGKVPSPNARPENNRFLQFAISGWEDAGGEPPTGTTFAQSALGAAVSHLKAAIGRDNNDFPDWARR